MAVLPVAPWDGRHRPCHSKAPPSRPRPLLGRCRAGVLQADRARSSAAVAQAVGLSVSAAGDRIRRLHSSGVVRASRAVLDPARLGLDLLAFVFVDLEPRADERRFAEALRALPEVQEAHHVTGPHSWLLKVRVRNAAALQRLIADRLKAMPEVMRTETLIGLDTAKETTELALPARAEELPR